MSQVKEEQEEARVGRVAVLAKRTAAEKAAALAATDDYKLDEVCLCVCLCCNMSV